MKRAATQGPPDQKSKRQKETNPNDTITVTNSPADHEHATHGDSRPHHHVFSSISPAFTAMRELSILDFIHGGGSQRLLDPVAQALLINNLLNSNDIRIGASLLPYAALASRNSRMLPSPLQTNASLGSPTGILHQGVADSNAVLLRALARMLAVPPVQHLNERLQEIQRATFQSNASQIMAARSSGSVPEFSALPFFRSQAGIMREEIEPLWSNRSSSNDRSGRKIAVSCSSDSSVLSDYQCFLREQLLFAEADPAEIESSARGRNIPIGVGQVGILCRHCANLPLRDRPRGAAYFPAKLIGLYPAAQNMMVNHFAETCGSIPAELRSKLLALKEQCTKAKRGSGKEYWSQAAMVLGIYETESSGLRMSDHVRVQGTAIVPSTARPSAPSHASY